MNPVAVLARRYAEAYRESWLAGDARRAAALYAPECRFRSSPFRALEDPVAYTLRVLPEAEATRVWFGEPLVIDDERVVLEWWAQLVEDGDPSTLTGTDVMRFEPGGAVTEVRSIWTAAQGHLEPPPGWGR